MGGDKGHWTHWQWTGQDREWLAVGQAVARQIRSRAGGAGRARGAGLDGLGRLGRAGGAGRAGRGLQGGGLTRLAEWTGPDGSKTARLGGLCCTVLCCATQAMQCGSGGSGEAGLARQGWQGGTDQASGGHCGAWRVGPGGMGSGLWAGLS